MSNRSSESERERLTKRLFNIRSKQDLILSFKMLYGGFFDLNHWKPLFLSCKLQITVEQIIFGFNDSNGFVRRWWVKKHWWGIRQQPEMFYTAKGFFKPSHHFVERVWKCPATPPLYFRLLFTAHRSFLAVWFIRSILRFKVRMQDLGKLLTMIFCARYLANGCCLW